MKNKIKIALFLLLVCGLNVVCAGECAYTEKYSLMQEAAKVKIKYEPYIETIEDTDCTDEEYCLPLEERYFRIYLTNVSENVYVDLKNEATGESTKYRYTDSQEGIITIDGIDTDNIKNYSMKVYASDSTNCSGESLATQYITLPRYNSYSTEDYCQEHKDEKYCEEYVEFDDVDYNTFFENTIEKDNDINETITEMTIGQKVMGFIEDNLVWVLCGCIVLIGVVVITKTSTGKRREK